jgi:hypothetical protein
MSAEDISAVQQAVNVYAGLLLHYDAVGWQLDGQDGQDNTILAIQRFAFAAVECIGLGAG